MSEHEYSYSILKYRHDAAADEVLNFGVVICCPATRQIGILLDGAVRLSATFLWFDTYAYFRITELLQERLCLDDAETYPSLTQFKESLTIQDAAAWVREAWPDQGLSYFASPSRYGVTGDIEKELTNLFQRFVRSQHDFKPGQVRA